LLYSGNLATLRREVIAPGQSASFRSTSPLLACSQANATPLHRRMTDDMRMRQLSPKTQETDPGSDV